MSKDTDPDGIFDSMPPAGEHTLPGPGPGPGPNPDPGPARAVGGSEKPPFDPYKFQHLTVSPTLRQELSAAKLPRLDPEFFQDTLPPNHVMASSAGPPGSENVEFEPLVVPLRRRTWIVVALLFGVGAGVWFAVASGTATDPTAPVRKESNSHPAVTDVRAHTVVAQPEAPASVPAVASAVGAMPEPAPAQAPAPALATLPSKTVERGEGAPERSQANPKKERVPAAKTPAPRKTSVFDSPLIPADDRSAP
jgi:hypothetical protein